MSWFSIRNGKQPSRQCMFSLKVYKKTAQIEKATYGSGVFFDLVLFIYLLFFFPFQSYQEQSTGLLQHLWKVRIFYSVEGENFCQIFQQKSGEITLSNFIATWSFQHSQLIKLASSQVICLTCNGKRMSYNLSHVSKHSAVFHCSLHMTTNQSRFSISLFSTDVLGHRKNIFQMMVSIEIKVVNIIYADTESRKEI